VPGKPGEIQQDTYCKQQTESACLDKSWPDPKGEWRNLDWITGLTRQVLFQHRFLRAGVFGDYLLDILCKIVMEKWNILQAYFLFWDYYNTMMHLKECLYDRYIRIFAEF
jgi:hypothetical protein